MGRAATITYEQVAAIADRLNAQGERPTVRIVRDQLGGGSQGTVHKLLSQWQVGKGRQPEATLTLPPSLQRTILDFISREMAEQRRELDASLADAQQTASDIASENERLTNDIQELNDAVNAERGRSSLLEGRLEQLQGDLEQNKKESMEAIDSSRKNAEREREAADGLRVELAKASLRLEGVPRLEAEIGRLHGELDDERAARHEAERNEAASLASLEATRERVAGFELTLTEQKQRSAEVITKSDADKRHLSAELVETRREAKDCIAKLARLEGVFEQIKSSAEAPERKFTFDVS
jgi:chromosome segregation ATPase